MAIRMLASTAPDGWSPMRALASTTAVAGYQECGLSGKAGGDATGLSNTTTYYLKINHNGTGVTEKSITTASTTTFTAVIALLNAQMTGVLAGVVWGLSSGDLRCTSGMYGTASSIALSAGTTGSNFFAALTGFSAFDTAVAGLGPTEDPNGYSAILTGGYSKVYPLNGCSNVTVQGGADTAITGTITVEAAMTPDGPWASVGTLTNGLGFVNFPAGSHYEFTRINAGSFTGGPLHCNMDAYHPNGNRIW